MLLTTTALALCAQDVHVRVDPKGPGSTASSSDYTTIQQALDHASEAPHGRIIISIVPGVYHRPRVTLLGLGKLPEDVVIVASQNAKEAGGTFFTETAEINGDNFEADNVTFANDAGNTGQAVAAAVRSDRAVFKHCRFLGHQDTLFADYGRQYYVDSYIEGGTDFIFGNATADGAVPDYGLCDRQLARDYGARCDGPAAARGAWRGLNRCRTWVHLAGQAVAALLACGLHEYRASCRAEPSRLVGVEQVIRLPA
jgi:hypothetical protein